MGALLWNGANAVTWFLAGLLYANAAEWLLHRYLLHGVGKRRTSFWNFHWGEHHRACRREAFHDADYRRSPLGWHAQGKEFYGLLALLLCHVPLFWVAPSFAAAVAYGVANYLVKHRRSHLDPQWARAHLPWHYDHHMGKNQDANWCVTRPLFDWIMGTRVHYAHTAAEARDLERAASSRAVEPAVVAAVAAVDAADVVDVVDVDSAGVAPWRELPAAASSGPVAPAPSEPPPPLP